MPKIVSIFAAPEGHLSLGQALYEKLSEQGFQVHLNLYGNWEFILYRPFYRSFPKLLKIPYNLGEYKLARITATKYAKRQYLKSIKTDLVDQKPHVVINTWFMFNPILESLSPTHNFLHLNLVPDPWSFHPITVSQISPNLVFDEQAATFCHQIGIKKNLVSPIGWFVRPAFEASYQKSAIQKQLGLDSRLTFLVTGGSEGSNKIYDLVSSLYQQNHRLQIIVICGTNQQLFYKISKLHSSSSQTRLIPLGFTHQIHQYMQAADLVIGKAGPNQIFESVATHTPFFAITHLPGQEEGNLELIQTYKLGYVEERPQPALSLLQRLIHTPKLLESSQEPLASLAKTNQQSINHLIKLIDQHLTE